MITRNMYIGYAAENFSAVHPALARYEQYVFLYLEGSQKPEEIISEGLIPFPGGRLWVPMADIFHYSRPLSEEHWKRGMENKITEFRVAYLKPECISEYIYYHYLLQEEQPGLCDKYGMIFLHENMLVMYLEYPREPETEKYRGKLDSHNTPENMSELVNQCFQIHEDIGVPWKVVKKGSGMEQ